MGWCQDFSVEIAGGCSHPMRPGLSYCSCDECGVVCHGKFDGCPEVWIQLSAPTKEAGRLAKHPALSRRPGGGETPAVDQVGGAGGGSGHLTAAGGHAAASGEDRAGRTVTRVEGAVDAMATTAAARGADVEQPTDQTVMERLAGMVATAVQAALAEQAAVTDQRFTQLNDVVAQIEADAATHALQLVERLRNVLARHDEVVEARLDTYQLELNRLSTVVTELTQGDEHDDPERADDPLGAASARLEETVAALSEENDQLRARLATQESLVDQLQRSVSVLVADQAQHDHAAVGRSVAAALEAEVSDLRREVGRLRSQTRGNGEAFRRSIEERVVAVESQSEELEDRITARVEGELTSKFATARDTNRQHEELRREMARRQAELEDRLGAQRQTLVAIQGAVAKLALYKGVHTAPAAAAPAPTPAVAPIDEDRGGGGARTERLDRTRHSGRRTEVSALLGANWHGRTDEPAGDRGDRALSRGAVTRGADTRGADPGGACPGEALSRPAPAGGGEWTAPPRCGQGCEREDPGHRRSRVHRLSRQRSAARPG